MLHFCDVESGTQVGVYQLGNRLGQGRAGVVYQATHLLRQQPVALRVLDTHWNLRPEAVEKFRQESQIAASLRHPGIAVVREWGFTPDGRTFAVTDLFEGQTLAERLQGSPAAMPQAFLLNVARQLASVLAAAHIRQLIHRSLKPENVFLERELSMPGGVRVRLADFGIANLYEAESPEYSPPEYMAPEQLARGRLSPATDLYSLGCLLYHMACGRPPFVGAPERVRHGHLYEAPAPLEAVEKSASADVANLILRLLDKQVEQRPQTAMQVLDAVNTVDSRQLRASTHPPNARPVVVIEDEPDEASTEAVDFTSVRTESVDFSAPPVSGKVIVDKTVAGKRGASTAPPIIDPRAEGSMRPPGVSPSRAPVQPEALAGGNPSAQGSRGQAPAPFTEDQAILLPRAPAPEPAVPGLGSSGPDAFQENQPYMAAGGGMPGPMARSGRPSQPPPAGMIRAPHSQQGMDFHGGHDPYATPPAYAQGGGMSPYGSAYAPPPRTIASRLAIVFLLMALLIGGGVGTYLALNSGLAQKLGLGGGGSFDGGKKVEAETAAPAPAAAPEKPAEPKVAAAPTLERPEEPPSIEPGNLATKVIVFHTIETTPKGATVIRDGEVVGTTPYGVEEEARPGKVTFLIRKEGYQEERVELFANRTGHQTLTLRRVGDAPTPHNPSAAPEPISPEPMAVEAPPPIPSTPTATPTSTKKKKASGKKKRRARPSSDDEFEEGFIEGDEFDEGFIE